MSDIYDDDEQWFASEFVGHTHTVWWVVFSPDGKLITSSSDDGKVILWSVTERKMIQRISAHQNQIASLCFSKDGKRIVSASEKQLRFGTSSN
jgi:WD40 repeat protein